MTGDVLEALQYAESEAARSVKRLVRNPDIGMFNLGWQSVNFITDI